MLDERVVLGGCSYFGRDLVLSSMSPISIGTGARVGERVSLHTEDHGPPDARDVYRTDRISIGDDVWLGAGVVVTRGVRIGSAVTVGANAVVTRDLCEPGVYGGVPARLLGLLPAKD